MNNQLGKSSAELKGKGKGKDKGGGGEGKLLIDPKSSRIIDKGMRTMLESAYPEAEDEMLKGLRDEARIENEVRTRLQVVLSAAGMSSDGVAKEVLYWLPAEFLRWYRDLYLRALALGDGSDRGRQSQRTSDLGKAIVDEKEYKGKRVGAGKGGGPGGRYRGEWIVKDEEALEELGRINKELLMILYEGIQGRTEFVKKVGAIVDREMEGKRKGREGRIRRVCGDCNKLMATEWKRCPFHE